MTQKELESITKLLLYGGVDCQLATRRVQAHTYLDIGQPGVPGRQDGPCIAD
jgi:hypothetical protein